MASGDPLAGVQGASEMPVSSAQQCRAGTARLSAGVPVLLGQPLGFVVRGAQRCLLWACVDRTWRQQRDCQYTEVWAHGALIRDPEGRNLCG